jgi:hypothetical protein
VVKVPLAATVLNPRSHRIRAELESRGDEADVVTSDPYSGEAQDLTLILHGVVWGCGSGLISVSGRVP